MNDTAFGDPADRPRDLGGRVAVVTGASQGIGLAIAASLRWHGAHVVLVARKQAGLQQARDQLLATPGPGDIDIAVGNAGDEGHAELTMRSTVSRFGHVDVLVNNAATNPYFGPLLDIDASRAAKTVQVNQFGPLAWSRCAWHDGGMSTRGGSIVNVASIGALIVDPGTGYYNATKAALLAMTKQLAYELGPQVTVNAVAPGIVKTEFAREIWEAEEERLTTKLPLRRLGTPEDIAEAVLFLVGPGARWITGHTLIVDGGAMCIPTWGES